MQPDDEICYCYHVSLRKLANFSRRVKPETPSRMSECLGAGTGCGWCIPFLTRIAREPDALPREELTPEDYAQRRRDYLADDQTRNSFDATGP